MSPFPAFRLKRYSGFTLVETAIAVWIVASVLLALVALLPIGLGSLSNSNAQTAHARIVQDLSADYRMWDWEKIDDQSQSGSSEEYFYDRRGLEVPNGDDEHLWTARVEISKDIKMPVEGSISPLNSYARRLEISIGRAAVASSSVASELAQYSTIISQFDK